MLRSEEFEYTASASGGLMPVPVASQATPAGPPATWQLGGPSPGKTTRPQDGTRLSAILHYDDRGGVPILESLRPLTVRVLTPGPLPCPPPTDFYGRRRCSCFIPRWDRAFSAQVSCKDAASLQTRSSSWIWRGERTYAGA